MKKNIIIVGTSGHAKVIIDIIEQENAYNILGLIDKQTGDKNYFCGYPILGTDADLPAIVANNDVYGAIVAIGDNYIRSSVVKRLSEIQPELRYVKAIHPKAYISKHVNIGDGTVIMAGVSVNPSCSIGKHCILNTNSSLDHDSTMADFSSIAPGGTTGGNCQIGTCTAIGIGAAIIHNTAVGEHTIVGAGSTVLKDLDSFSVAYGSPAKIIRKREPGERYL